MSPTLKRLSFCKLLRKNPLGALIKSFIHSFIHSFILPSKGFSHLCYAAISRIIPSDEPRDTTSYCLSRCDVLLLVGGPRRCGIFSSWSKEL